jgi:hypothetical protein
VRGGEQEGRYQYLMALRVVDGGAPLRHVAAMSKTRPTLPVPIEPNSLYRKSAVAEVLGVSEKTLDSCDDIPWSRIGPHTRRIMGSTLIEWVRSRSATLEDVIVRSFRRPAGDGKQE